MEAAAGWEPTPLQNCILPDTKERAKKSCQEFLGWQLTFSALETEVEVLPGELYYEEL